MRADELALARMFRPSCTNCGANGLVWQEGRQFATTADGQARLLEVVTNSGGHLSMADCLNSHVWTCKACDELGVFL
jgi:hypothetical protein